MVFSLNIKRAIMCSQVYLMGNRQNYTNFQDIRKVRADSRADFNKCFDASNSYPVNVLEKEHMHFFSENH